MVNAVISEKLAVLGRFDSRTLAPLLMPVGLFEIGVGVSGIRVRFGAGLCATTNGGFCIRF